MHQNRPTGKKKQKIRVAGTDTITELRGTFSGSDDWFGIFFLRTVHAVLASYTRYTPALRNAAIH